MMAKKWSYILFILSIIFQIISTYKLSNTLDIVSFSEVTGGKFCVINGNFAIGGCPSGAIEPSLPVAHPDELFWGVVFFAAGLLIQSFLFFSEDRKRIEEINELRSDLYSLKLKLTSSPNHKIQKNSFMSLSLIAGISKNNCIGKNGQLPWHIPEDLKHFRKMTAGKIVLMGRKTWESLPEKFRPLPNRTNIVITRQADYSVPVGVKVYATIDEAVAAHPNEEIIVIGGAEIYKQTIDRADRLYITHINQTVDGDAFFPTIDLTVWQENEREDRGGFSFVTYTRK